MTALAMLRADLMKRLDAQADLLTAMRDDIRRRDGTGEWPNPPPLG